MKCINILSATDFFPPLLKGQNNVFLISSDKSLTKFCSCEKDFTTLKGRLFMAALVIFCCVLQENKSIQLSTYRNHKIVLSIYLQQILYYKVDLALLIIGIFVSHKFLSTYGNCYFLKYLCWYCT